MLKYESFLFKLYSSFQYVNSPAEISARAEISPCNQPLNRPKVKLNWPKVKINWPKDKINWPKIKLTGSKIKLTHPRINFTLAEIPARLLTYGKEKTNLNRNTKCVLKYESFLFKLYSSFQYVNSRAEISARAEISPCNQPLNRPKVKINWPKDKINWPKDKINWLKDKINSPKDKFHPG